MIRWLSHFFPSLVGSPTTAGALQHANHICHNAPSYSQYCKLFIQSLFAASRRLEATPPPPSSSRSPPAERRGKPCVRKDGGGGASSHLHARAGCPSGGGVPIRAARPDSGRGAGGLKVAAAVVASAGGALWRLGAGTARRCRRRGPLDRCRRCDAWWRRRGGTVANGGWR